MGTKLLFDFFLGLLFPPKCQVCGKLGPEALCVACRSQIKVINTIKNNIHCVSSYEGVMKKAIKALKFRNRVRLAVPLGRILEENVTLSCFDMIIAVPLHKKRLKERGFNQSELLAGGISSKYGIPVLNDVLIRQKQTIHQFDLNRHERMTNVAGAFGITDTGSVQNKRILLLDDIYTTGSTVRECEKVLKTSGASFIYIACLSRAMDL